MPEAWLSGEIIIETDLRAELDAFQLRAFGNLDGEAFSTYAAETFVIGQNFDGMKDLAVLGALLRCQLAGSELGTFLVGEVLADDVGVTGQNLRLRRHVVEIEDAVYHGSFLSVLLFHNKSAACWNGEK